tara:strand:- start:645 stop:815 length:171 start_codon:yes stop_codon:yes gene_type:complete
MNPFRKPMLRRKLKKQMKIKKKLDLLENSSKKHKKELTPNKKQKNKKPKMMSNKKL